MRRVMALAAGAGAPGAGAPGAGASAGAGAAGMVAAATGAAAAATEEAAAEAGAAAAGAGSGGLGTGAGAGLSSPPPPSEQQRQQPPDQARASSGGGGGGGGGGPSRRPTPEQRRVVEHPLPWGTPYRLRLLAFAGTGAACQLLRATSQEVFQLSSLGFEASWTTFDVAGNTCEALGTGKTTTLAALAHRHSTKRILYLAYNADVSEEAKTSTFARDTHVTCLTTHALAKQRMVKAGLMKAGYAAGYSVENNLTHAHVIKAVRGAGHPTLGEAAARTVVKVVEGFLSSKDRAGGFLRTSVQPTLQVLLLPPPPRACVQHCIHPECKFCFDLCSVLVLNDPPAGR